MKSASQLASRRAGSSRQAIQRKALAFGRQAAQGTRAIASTASLRSQRSAASGSTSRPPRKLASDVALSSASRQRPHFDKILVANRGEIACRVIRTAARLGIKTVAIYSDADANAMHVHQADEAIRVGPAPSSESYLNVDAIVRAAKLTGAQAIHPGYGFLSENADFAERLAKEGIVFIGPPPSAIRSMGSKSESKTIMIAAGVPCVPGFHGENQDAAFLADRAHAIGYPVLIKATKGGGGKGMKIVESPADFSEALESAQREALKSFGDETVLIEKYIPKSRHVEVQVFGDQFGETVYLFERDCSVQRRHQKIIEEAPAPGLPPELRKQLGEKAVAAAKAVHYVGAGTVEFLLDVRDNSFFYMETNTRLQVEHPITEMITGTDLVEWQLEVAAGNPLPMKQHELSWNGHAFEARIYAEKPANNFLPDVGRLVHVRTPRPTESVRVETGFDTGDEISVHYDPMIAKLVVHGKDREAALRILRKALAEYEIVGPSTNIAFLHALASHPSFVAGEVSTAFINEHHDQLFAPLPETPPEAYVAAALFGAAQEMPVEQVPTPWSTLAGRRFGGAEASSLPLSIGQAPGQVSVQPSAATDPPHLLDVTILDKKGGAVLFPGIEAAVTSSGLLNATLPSLRLDATVVPSDSGQKLHIFGPQCGAPAGGTALDIPEPEWLLSLRAALPGQAGGGSAKAPMPCKVIKVFVKPGEEVRANQALVAVEAMKTELLLRAPVDATVLAVGCKEGDLVPEGKDLVTFQLDEPVGDLSIHQEGAASPI